MNYDIGQCELRRRSRNFKGYDREKMINIKLIKGSSKDTPQSALGDTI